MVRFIKCVSVADEVLDCIPVVSTVTNLGILLYQLVHKVNTVANPVNASWQDDIKIHALSKHAIVSGVAMIPVLGNLIMLCGHLRDVIIRALKGELSTFGPKGYLGRAVEGYSPSLQKHSNEVVALYLARNPDRSEEKLIKPLKIAAELKNEEMVKRLLDLRDSWTANAIKEVLLEITADSDSKFPIPNEKTISIQTAKYVLEKQGQSLSDEQAGELLVLASDRARCESGLVELLLDRYPDIKIPAKGVINVVKYTSNHETAKAVLKKHSNVLSDKEASEIVSFLIKLNTKIELIDQLTNTHPNMDIDPIGSALAYVVSERKECNLVHLLDFLLERFPSILEDYLKIALLSTSNIDNIQFFHERRPRLVNSYVNQLILEAVRLRNVDVFNFLCDNYQGGISVDYKNKIKGFIEASRYSMKPDTYQLFMGKIN